MLLLIDDVSPSSVDATPSPSQTRLHGRDGRAAFSVPAVMAASRAQFDAGLALSSHWPTSRAAAIAITIIFSKCGAARRWRSARLRIDAVVLRHSCAAFRVGRRCVEVELVVCEGEGRQKKAERSMTTTPLVDERHQLVADFN